MKQVYVAAPVAGPVKIGISRNPAHRIRGFMSPEAITLQFASAARLDAKAIETLAHGLLADRRLNGEWFDVSIDQAIETVEQAIAEIDHPGARSPLNGYGSVLRRLRGSRTQMQQAALIGLSPQHLCDLEAERRDVRLSTLKKLAELYGISLAELVDPQHAARSSTGSL
jgi:DNA-binding XRE family transcriptional regulator